MSWYWRGSWLVIPALIVVAAIIISAEGGPEPQNTLLNAESDIQVDGFAELIAAGADKRNYNPGDTLRINLSWLTHHETQDNFKGFVHLMDQADARVIAQTDGDPVGGFTPTSQWRHGELIEETRAIRIPDDAAPGAHRLYAGLYRPQPLQNLPATRRGLPEPDGRILLGEIQVAAK